jgi:hypothetical protein
MFDFLNRNKVEELEDEIVHLNKVIKNLAKASYDNYYTVANPTLQAQEHADAIKTNLMLDLNPILKEHVLKEVAKIDWRNSDKKPSLYVAGASAPDELRVMRYHFTLPELHLTFEVANYD